MTYLTIENIACDAVMRHRLILIRWVQRAEEMLWAEEPPIPLSVKARRKLSLLLFARLDMIARQTLDDMLGKKLVVQNPAAALSLDFVPRKARETAADDLLQELVESGCTAFDQNVPLLKGLLDHCVDQFVRVVQEMLTRIAENRCGISTLLPEGKDMGEIVGFSHDGADFHADGRCTLCIECDGGRFFYKPRDCRMDAIYEGLIKRWFSDITDAPRCLDFDGYGFCEFIHASSVNTIHEIRRCFYNFGGLTALLHALGSHDLHMQNFLIRSEKPILVDLETLLTARPRSFGEDAVFVPETDFDRALKGSLFYSGLLPRYEDNMETSPLLDRSSLNRGLPVLDGSVQTVLDHEAAFMEGFRKVYLRCMDIRDELTSALNAFSTVRIRRLVRSSDYYGRMLLKIYAPAALHSVDERDKVLSLLCNYFERMNVPHMMTIAEAEKRALIRGDIPYFYAVGDGTDLMSDGEPVQAGYFEIGALENARNRISHLSPDELHFEEKLMHESFHMALVPLDEDQNLPMVSGDPDPLPDACLMAEADAILNRLCAAVVTAPCGAAGWLVNRDHSPSAMREDLPSGMAGLGAFFAAHYSVSENAQALKCAGICAETLQSFLAEMEKASDVQLKNLVPGLDGVAGILRAMDIMEGCVGICLSNRLIRQLNRFDLENGGLDVFSGVSALILALGNRDAQITSLCAETLLQRKNLVIKDGPALWDTIGKKRPVSGMGHGMAGIAAALMRAYDMLGDERCLQAAQDAFAWEASAFSEQLQTWPDLREPGKNTAMHGYCSGAPGIGLALLACEKYADSIPEYSEMLNLAIDACQNHPVMFRDHLCCGNAAAVEFLMTAGRKLDRGDLLLAARQLASRMISRKKDDYAFVAPLYRPFFSTSLYYGAAGVGYTFLRLVDADIPSVLL